MLRISIPVVPIRMHANYKTSTMKINKKIGIWMDYSVAYITQLRDNMLETTIVNSHHPDQEKGMDTDRSGGSRERVYDQYYMKLGEIISDYDEVLLFGPGEAKQQLINRLRANYLFSNIKIELRPGYRMSRDEQHEFFRNHFMKVI
jgi:stalled ribosome rescue protein Dom34